MKGGESAPDFELKSDTGSLKAYRVHRKPCQFVKVSRELKRRNNKV